MASSSLSSTVLGKRKTTSLVLHLQSDSQQSNSESGSDSEYEEEYEEENEKGKGLPPMIINGQLVANTKKRYKCTYEGCTKAYTKPSRLEEHERSHTGDRPFVCETCRKSYLRETHLQAHARSHLPESSRPLACPQVGCERRFWTTQHLKIHQDMHNGAKPYSCTEDSCPASFSKHHQLRAHIASAHSPPGTKPYICPHDGCSKSFATNQKLSTHEKVHDGKRYTCVHPDCTTKDKDREGDGQKAYYGTWTALQAHIKVDHPPRCPHEGCNKRVFASHHNLRAHLKLHEEREVEEGLDDDADADVEDEAGDGRRPKKRRRGGDLGRDWKCCVEGCNKEFKSKKALKTHHNVTHLGKRDYICPHEYCESTFAYKHLLQRHLGKVHTSTGTVAAAEEEGEERNGGGDGGKGKEKLVQRMDIDAITGKAYNSLASSRLDDPTSNALRCPHPHPLTTTTTIAAASSSKGCEYVFKRTYDLRRHLKAEHGVVVEKEVVDKWVRGERRKAVKN